MRFNTLCQPAVRLQRINIPKLTINGSEQTGDGTATPVSPCRVTPRASAFYGFPYSAYFTLKNL